MRNIAKKIRKIQNKIVHWIQSLILASSRGYRSSVMGAFTGFGAIAAIALFVVIEVSDTAVRVACFLIIFLFIIAWLVAYFYSLVKHPENLRSETFMLESKKLDIIASKGEPPRMFSENELPIPQPTNLIEE